MTGMADIIKYVMVAAGVFIMVFSFWYHSVRKLTVNLAVIWEIFSVILIVTGVIPVLSSWIYHISTGTGLVLLFVGIVCIWGGFQFSLLVSRLAMKNQELAMQVSLLIKENEKIAEQLKDLEDRMRAYEEKASVRD